MEIDNFFQINDWEIKKFLIFIFTIQFSLLGLIILDSINLSIPFLRELIGLLYLFFIPGLLILRIMRLHDLGDIQTILYSLCLSIANIMFVGFFLNILYSLLGISSPMSLIPLITAMFINVVFLSVLTYIMDKKYSKPKKINLNQIFAPKTLFLSLIPFLAIFGTYLMSYNINIVSMILIFVIALIVILVAFKKIPIYLYPFTVFLIALSLLFHTSLLSTHLWGWDINTEYYFSSLVINNNSWNSQIVGNVNAMLPITILIPLIKIILNVNLVWVYKIVISFLFAFVPLGLYEIFRNQSNEKIAFLASFFFVSIFSFYTEMPQLARQQIAELFLVMMILLMVNYEMPKIKKSILMIIAIFAIVVSHYGLSYILLLMFITLLLIIYFVQTNLFHASLGKIEKIFKIERIFNIRHNSFSIGNMVTFTFVLLFFIFTLMWYIYVSSSSPFETIINIGNHIISSIFTDFLNPESSQGLAVINVETHSKLHDIPKYLNLLFQFFILIGIFSVLRSPKRFKKEYVIFGFLSLFILFLCILIPNFASSLNLTRIYHISLFFLAPFAIVGGIISFKILSKVLNKYWNKQKFELSIKIISGLLCLLFLFYSGFIYEITGDNPTSFAISDVDYAIYSYPEFIGASWISKVGKKDHYLFADQYRSQLFREFPGRILYNFPRDPTKIVKNSYFYFGKFNLINSKILVNNSVSNESYTDINDYINNRNKIYDNGLSNLYYSKV